MLQEYLWGFLLQKHTLFKAPQIFTNLWRLKKKQNILIWLENLYKATIQSGNFSLPPM